MAETCCTEIYFVLSGYSKDLANSERREKCHLEINDDENQVGIEKNIYTGNADNKIL